MAPYEFRPPTQDVAQTDRYAKRAPGLVVRATLGGEGGERWRLEALPEDAWSGVPTPHSGMPRATVEAARKNLSDSYRPRKPAERYAELRGLLHCEGCGLRLTIYNTGKEKTTGKKYAYYV